MAKGSRFVVTQRLLRDCVRRADVASFKTYRAWPFTRELADLLVATEPEARAGLLQAVLDGQRVIGFGEGDSLRAIEQRATETKTAKTA